MTPEEKLAAIAAIQAFADRLEEMINEQTGWGKNRLLERTDVIRKDLFTRIRRGEEI